MDNEVTRSSSCGKWKVGRKVVRRDLSAVLRYEEGMTTRGQMTYDKSTIKKKKPKKTQRKQQRI